MKTIAVNIRHESFYVYIGRAGRGQDGYFGNPFILSVGESRGATLEKYKAYFCNRVETDPEFRSRIHALKGKNTGLLLQTASMSWRRHCRIFRFNELNGKS